ncbi:UNVERIFIED_CONTAM: Zfp60 [Trichonephila clavipes]
MKFNNEFVLNNLYITHSAEKPPKCDTCGKGFSTKIFLSVDYGRDIKERPNRCKMCDMTSPRKFDLDGHSVVHTTEKPCEKCSEIFKRKGNLKQHYSKHRTG